MEYCSLQQWILLSLPVKFTSTTEHHFRFASATFFFLELLANALRTSPLAYWTLLDMEGSSSSVISFLPFILFLGFSRQEYWSGLPFPPPVEQVLSELFTMMRPSGVALHGVARRCIELCKSFCHDRAMIHEGIHEGITLLTRSVVSDSS